MNDEAIESEIRAKGKTAPRVTPQDIEDCIVSEHYFTAADGAYGAAMQTGDSESLPVNCGLSLLTFCVLVLRNGYTVTGESACASPRIFDAEIGRTIARANAVEKIWPLEGYLLKQRLFEWAPKFGGVDEQPPRSMSPECVRRLTAEARDAGVSVDEVVNRALAALADEIDAQRHPFEDKTE